VNLLGLYDSFRNQGDAPHDSSAAPGTNSESVVATRCDMVDVKGDERLLPLLIHSRLTDPKLKTFHTRDPGQLKVATYKAYMAQMEYQRPLPRRNQKQVFMGQLRAAV